MELLIAKNEALVGSLNQILLAGGFANVQSKVSPKSGWHFRYMTKNVRNKFAIQVFGNIKSPDFVFNVELASVNGGKKTIKEFNSFIEIANTLAGMEGMKYVSHLEMEQRTTTDKYYIDQPKFGMVYFQSPADSVISVGSVLPGRKANQLAKYANGVSLEDVPKVVEEMEKLVNYIIDLKIN